MSAMNVTDVPEEIRATKTGGGGASPLPRLRAFLGSSLLGVQARSGSPVRDVPQPTSGGAMQPNEAEENLGQKPPASFWTTGTIDKGQRDTDEMSTDSDSFTNSSVEDFGGLLPYADQRGNSQPLLARPVGHQFHRVSSHHSAT